jgi:hypothetical protein
MLSPVNSDSLNFCLLNCLIKSVFIEMLVGSKLKLMSFKILKYLPVNRESFFLNGSNLIELKLKL